MATPTKRARIQEPEQQTITSASEINARNCHLGKLPLELLADVLSYMPSTRDVLALARTSKQFCSILVNNPATVFIWRHARARCVLGAIPELLPGMGEATYAAFLFDSGICQACGKRSQALYYSFSLRVRLCEDTRKCLPAWQSSHLHEVTQEDEVEFSDIIQWIPRMERNEEPYQGKVYVRTDTWNEAIDERKRAYLLGQDAISAYVETKQVLADALPGKMEIYKKLIQWRDIRQNTRALHTQIGLATAKLHAGMIQCSKWEILQSPTYSGIHYAKLRCFEKWTEPQFEAIKEVVIAEIATLKKRKVVREQDLTLHRKRSESETEYARLRKADPKAIFPSFPEFRKLSVVKTVEASSSAKNASFTDPFVASLLKESLDQWRDAARAALAVVLGFTGWKTMSKKKLHPVDRMTAHFRCKRCDAAGKDTGKDGGLVLARACEHICALSKKARNKQRWSADYFVSDQRAVDAVSQVLELCGTKPESVDSFTIADSVGDRIQCTSCLLNMDARSVGRHCKRHEECAFTLLPETSVSGERLLQHGLTAKLMAHTTEAASQRDEKAYGCRHCRPALTSDQEPATQIQFIPKLMIFNGLRSHLKEKHGVDWVADEDFFIQKNSATPNGDRT
ncbi:uncharacterized protein TRAVEDRAFT_74096 [Trametes versicolor FP-101664 SS1]|uniref:uncharacterized protein n=1 Tax=Trametes versicolor (strain FP-101664) TaxID=717944 RepID=UPI00046238DA|nr:uncharacterized protein TRAVEDRAFT_74096 [Trametes versicolor FP-101664 SS1]EIW55199.1 hypothetical protein TRAVEDRAFT_74096 [Trametes versicolor FP-101664 SS1]